MRRIAFISVVLSATSLLGGEARSQVLYNQPGAPQGHLGGGLFELLMTGRDPGMRPLRSSAYGGPSQPGGYGQPAASGARYASRPADPTDEAVRREPDPAFRRQTVSYGGRETPGTIVVDTPSKFLYLVQGNGQALRYGIGVGRPGFVWAGLKTVSAKKEWPGWTPPPEMLLRRPDLPRHMEGGPANPLGARALYLGSSLYRIHGTNEPDTIGRNVSSGCIRMMNEDVTDLYDRVPVGTKVVVL